MLLLLLLLLNAAVVAALYESHPIVLLWLCKVGAVDESHYNSTLHLLYFSAQQNHRLRFLQTALYAGQLSCSPAARRSPSSPAVSPAWCPEPLPCHIQTCSCYHTGANTSVKCLLINLFFSILSPELHTFSLPYIELSPYISNVSVQVWSVFMRIHPSLPAASAGHVH